MLQGEEQLLALNDLSMYDRFDLSPSMENRSIMEEWYILAVKFILLDEKLDDQKATNISLIFCVILLEIKLALSSPSRY